ncbi:MAG: hypothetical protein QM652_07060 [Legionella sp.]|uniref:hypothetical protein n=1 Tax=Legionella sp. TaxID=459 RepID=UPI0039E3D351
MSAALSYCQKEFRKSLNNARGKTTIYDAFEMLEKEIKKLDDMTQLHLYSATTQFLDSLIQEPDDPINPLEVFTLRCQSILGEEYEAVKAIGLALAVIAISVAVIATGAALGLGVGVLLGLWQTPLMFLASLMAAEAPALGIAAASSSLGVTVGVFSGWMFFKELSAKTVLNRCIETVKESYLSESEVTINEENNSESLLANQ